MPFSLPHLQACLSLCLCMALGPQQEQTQDFCTWQKGKICFIFEKTEVLKDRILIACSLRDSQLGKRPTKATFPHSRAFPQTSQVDGANFSFDGLLCLTITSVCHFSRLVSSECGPDSEVTYPKKALATRHIPTPSYALHLGYRHSCTSHPWERWCSICITLLLSTTHPLFSPLCRSHLSRTYTTYNYPLGPLLPSLPLLAFGMQSRTLNVYPPPPLPFQPSGLQK